LAEPLIPTSVYNVCIETGMKEGQPGAGTAAWQILDRLPSKE